MIKKFTQFPFVIYLILIVIFVAEVSIADTLISKIDRSDGSRIIFYTKHIPKNRYEMLTVVIGGSACESIEPKFRSYSGIQKYIKTSVLGVEKYGLSADSTACPKSYLDNNTIDQRIEDHIQAIKHVQKSRPGLTKLLLLAGSSGGYVVPGIIRSFRTNISGIILLATGGGIQFKDELILLEKRKHGTQSSENLRKKLAQYSKHGFVEQTWKGASNSANWWKSVLNLSLMPELLTIDVPVFLAHGTQDLAVPVESADKIQEEFSKKMKDNLTYNRYVGLDHSWNTSNGESRARKVIDDMLQWIKVNHIKNWEIRK